MVETISGVVNTKRRPERSARSGGSGGPSPGSGADEVRIPHSAASTKRNETAFST